MATQCEPYQTLPNYGDPKSLNGKEILITGGTGSLGKTLVKLLIKDGHKPHGIRIFSRDELKQFHTCTEISEFQEKHKTNIKVAYIVGDIRNHDSLYRAFENVDVVINTAAMKQIPTCETNPLEAVMTNVGGVENIIKAALARNVKKVMHISTDKAVHAINLYGSTKAVAEKLITHANVYAGRKGMAFSCCRYGNVLGSRGSILPLFRQQISENKPITLTNVDTTRFWITLPRVGRFLLSRLKDMQGGEIFIPCMGAAKVTELIRYITPEPNYEIQIIGIRKGEKLHECLIAPEEICKRKEWGFEICNDGLYNVGGYYSNDCLIKGTWHLTKEQIKEMLEEEI